MEKWSPGNISHGTSNLLSGMNDIDAKSIHCIASNVVSIDSRDQDLPLVVVNEEATDHDDQPWYFLVRWLTPLISDSDFSTYFEQAENGFDFRDKPLKNLPPSKKEVIILGGKKTSLSFTWNDFLAMVFFSIKIDVSFFTHVWFLFWGLGFIRALHIVTRSLSARGRAKSQ